MLAEPTRPRGRTAVKLAAAVDRARDGSATPYSSWYGALWTLVIALDFYWLSNPLVFQSYDDSLRNACVATIIVVVLTFNRLKVPRVSVAVVALLAFGYASMLWSTAPHLTAGFTTNYLVIALLATVVATNADARTVAQGVTLGGALILALSIYALELDLPKASVPLGNTGYLAGVGTNRNILAYSLVLALAFGVSFLPVRAWARVLWALPVGFVLLGLFLTQSGTGMLAGAILVIAAVALGVNDRRRPSRAVRRRRRWVAPVVAVGIAVAAVVVYESLGKLLGRDNIGTLSGRLPLWKSIVKATTGSDRWIGSGWGTVWPHPWYPAPDNEHYQVIITYAGLALSHGHNAFFDLLPEIGLIGAALFALVWIQAVARAMSLRSWSRGTTPARLQASRAGLLGVLGLLLFGLTEPMSTIPLGWFVAVMLATGLVPVTESSTPGSPGTAAAAPGSGGARHLDTSTRTTWLSRRRSTRAARAPGHRRS